MDGRAKGGVPNLGSFCRGQSDSSENSKSALSHAAALHQSCCLPSTCSINKHFFSRKRMKFQFSKLGLVSQFTHLQYVNLGKSHNPSETAFYFNVSFLFQWVFFRKKMIYIQWHIVSVQQRGFFYLYHRFSLGVGRAVETLKDKIQKLVHGTIPSCLLLVSTKMKQNHFCSLAYTYLHRIYQISCQ